MSRTAAPTEQRFFGDVFRGRTVLVTGNTGFKGSWLSALLLRLGAKVFGLANDVPTDPALYEAIGLEDRLQRHFAADVRDLAAVRDAVGTVAPDFLFHLAAQPIVSDSYRDPVTTVSTNVLGTTHVLEALRLWDGPCTAIVVTSDKAYDNVEQVWGYREADRLGGKDVYSGSKGAAELVFASYFHSFFADRADRLRLATVRAGNVIGGGDWARDRIVVDCMRAWSRGERVRIRSPYATRPWQHVLEPLSGYLRLAQRLRDEPRLSGESFNFGPPGDQNKTVLELMAALARHWRFADAAEAYDYDDAARPEFGEATLLRLNCDKAEARLDWLPTLDFDRTVRMVGEWYYAYYREQADMLAHTMADIDRYLQHATDTGRSWAPGGGEAAAGPADLDIPARPLQASA